jgi:hypothetical protein
MMDASFVEQMPDNYVTESGNAMPQDNSMQYQWDVAEQNAARNIPGAPTVGGIPSGNRSNATLYLDPSTGQYTNMPTSTGEGTLQTYNPYGANYDANFSYGGGGGSADGNVLDMATRGAGGGISVNTPTPAGSSAPGYYEARENKMNAESKAFSDKMWAQKSGPSTSITPVSPGGMTSAQSGIPNRTTVQSATPTVAMPTYPTIESYQAPTIDKAQINQRIQEIMAPYASSLKRAVRNAMASRRYGSPTLERYAMGGAIEGYGQGLADVQGKASAAGRNAYFQEDYAPKVEAGRLNWQAKMQSALQNWQGQMQNYLQTMQHTTDQYTNA